MESRLETGQFGQQYPGLGHNRTVKAYWQIMIKKLDNFSLKNVLPQILKNSILNL